MNRPSRIAEHNGRKLYRAALSCPNCGKHDTYVEQSRGRESKKLIARRRVCRGCMERFTTYEIVGLPDVVRIIREVAAVRSRLTDLDAGLSKLETIDLGE